MSSSAGIKCEELHNARDPDAMAAILAPDFIGVFGDQGQQTMGKEEYIQVSKDIVASFPDIHWEWTETQELNDGTVTSKCVVTGTHTGAPFGFGPFPKIPANGVKCQNDPEYIEFIVEGDLVKKMKVIPAKGSFKTGPPGFYLQIGGKME